MKNRWENCHNKASASVAEQENQREYEDTSVQADIGQLEVEENQIMDKVRSITKLAALLGLDISGDHESDEEDLEDHWDDDNYDFWSWIWWRGPRGSLRWWWLWLLIMIM